MDYKKKYLKYKFKYLQLKKLVKNNLFDSTHLEQLGAAKFVVAVLDEIKEIPDNFIHVMSITKAVVGILYHIHEPDYPRDKILYKNNKVGDIIIGDALNMNSKLQNNGWNFEDFMIALDDNKNLLEYSKKKLHEADIINRLDYNDLMFQVLASTIEDAAEKFGNFMDDPVKKEMTKYYYFENKEGKKYDGFFKEGNGWKWRHTKDGEPTGPNGIWMTKDFA